MHLGNVCESSRGLEVQVTLSSVLQGECHHPRSWVKRVQRLATMSEGVT
eukprot:CAMPEP_0180654712 /NCGR_PEP_ID=MMETSP1037_2-20121125/54860_1 /TAXON_ID=632150 /ORGANISM="Azadinium spinosum, Strain 3D9" /LENGTH=48 /DNA_ID= /DNA_START= /DNA_END= /DNA_ORIENTATION=